MDNDSLAALNNAAASLTNTASVINAANASRKQRKWMEQMYDKQRAEILADRADARAYALDMWDMQNRYNSPVESMARMREAGINPNNAASALAGVSANATAPQPLNNPVASVPSPYQDTTGSVLSQSALNYSQLANLNAQTSKLKADTAKVEAETDKVYADTDVVRQQLKGMLYDYEHLSPRRVKELDAIIDKSLTDKRLTDAEITQVSELTKRTIKEIDRIDYEIERLESEVKVNNERVKSEVVGRERDRASAAASRASSRLDEARKEQQDLFNSYERELQSFGTSSQSSSNPIINAKDQAAVMVGRGAKNAKKSVSRSIERRSFSDVLRSSTYRSMPNAPRSSDWRDELGH